MKRCAVCNSDFEMDAIAREWSQWLFPDMNIEDPTQAVAVCPSCIREALTIGLGVLTGPRK